MKINLLNLWDLANCSPKRLFTQPLTVALPVHIEQIPTHRIKSDFEVIKEGDYLKVYWYPTSFSEQKIINYTSEIINPSHLYLGCYWFFFTRFKVGQIYDLWCMISDLWFFCTLLDLWGINRPLPWNLENRNFTQNLPD